MTTDGRWFPGQVVIVTGAAKGIGQATAVAFAREGARVVINYLADEAGARETLAQIESEGGQGRLFQSDVAQPADVDRLVNTIETEWGPIRALVNNAAAFDRQPFLEVPLAALDRVWATNVRGLFYLSQCVARRMAERRQGSIVHVSSILARQLVAGRSAYGATKGAVESLTFAMAVELGPYNVRVNAVVPGLIRTQALLTGMPDPARQALVETYIPSGRLGHPSEMADVIVYLSSDKAHYINGALIPVDGGLSAREAGPK